ncbi:hypothetical protein [Roseovarius sp. D22-M7]|uniref:hypothetical protein n=1 Tax=Roseovarius sp. D22-M7 TaxID=3127116 RepID=UPI0030106007
MKRPPGSELFKFAEKATPEAQELAKEMVASKAAADRTIADRIRDAAVAAAAAGQAAGSAAKATAEAVADTVVATGKAVGSAAIAGADWVAERGKDVLAVGGSAVVVTLAIGLGSRAYVESKVLEPFNDVRRTFGDGPCFECEAAASAGQRKTRIRNRERLMELANAIGNDDLKRHAETLKDDMEGVEMARLSDDVYRCWPTDGSECKDKPEPPAPWSAVLDENELKEMGIKPAFLKEAKARIYRLPEGFPGGPKTVLAFRGTTGDLKDIHTNHDQALQLEEQQYRAAKALGRQLARAQNLGKAPNAMVTGHSLGGGKAQAAGVAGGLSGIMHNSAGLSPATVPGKNLTGAASRFTQYRSSNDPLTGLQNSLAAQTAVVAALTPLVRVASMTPIKSLIDDKLVAGDHERAALFARILGDGSDGPATAKSTLDRAEENMRKYGYAIPPALGKINTVEPRLSDGAVIGSMDAGNQHSCVNLINGIEQRKYDTIDTMRSALGNPGRQSDYIAGPGGGVIGIMKHYLN